MKKATLALLFFLIVAMSFSSLCIVPESTRATTLYVGGAGVGNYSKIQDAIDNATTLDTVFVYSGTYYENLILMDSIFLIGEDRGNTIIDGGWNADVVYVYSDWVKVSGFTIRNSNPGANYAGVKLYVSDDCLVTNNSFTGNRVGIYVHSSFRNTVTFNILSNNQEGIWVSGYSRFNNVSGNSVTSSSGDGIYVKDSHDNILYGNQLNSNSGHAIHLSGSFGNTIINNTLVGNGDGIGLFSSDESTIDCNDVSSSERNGVLLLSSNGNTLSSNTISSSGEIGISLEQADDNHLTGNSLTSNTVYGIRLHSSLGNNITENEIWGNGDGVGVFFSESNTVANNTIAMNEMTGINLMESHRNIILNNTVASSYWFGAYLSASGMNLVHHNSFVGNAKQARDDSIDNEWDDDYPSGGNFWMDYAGVDAYSGPNQDQSGSDGIGDMPYTIGPSTSNDRYPLMTSPFTLPLLPPTAPRNLQATAGNQQVSLSWGAPRYDGGSPVTNYAIYRGTVPGSGTFLVEIGSEVTYTDTGVVNGQTYYYQVSARNALGEGVKSAEGSAMPDGPQQNQLPVCTISTPEQGQTVSGTHKIMGTAHDPDGTLMKVEVRIDDGPWVRLVGTPFWSYFWNTTEVTDGEHTIHARSWDGTGYSEVVNVTVFVENRLPGGQESLLGRAWLWVLVAATIAIIIVLVVLLWIRSRRQGGETPEE